MNTAQADGYKALAKQEEIEWRAYVLDLVEQLQTEVASLRLAITRMQRESDQQFDLRGKL